MLIDTTEKKEIAELILGIRIHESRKSTLQLALECGRFHLGIDNNSNINEHAFNLRHNLIEQIQDKIIVDKCSDQAEIFAALLLYLNAMEQIGTLFCHKNGIENAIKTFGPEKFSNQKINAIKNLRNSLAHNYGLVNFNPITKKPTVKFTIYLDRNEAIVELPKKNWDGSYKDKYEETQCVIYAFSLLDLMKQTYDGVINKYKEGSLLFAIDDLEEIKARFTIIMD